MAPIELLNLVRQRPFEPFRIRTSAGDTLEVRHPEMCMVGVRTTIIGIPAESDPRLWDRTIRVDNLHVTHIEPLPTSMVS